MPFTSICMGLLVAAIGALRTTCCSSACYSGVPFHLSTACCCTHTTHVTWGLGSTWLIAALTVPLSAAVRRATAPHPEHPGVEHPPLLPAAGGQPCSRQLRVCSWLLQLRIG
jgi:hypothetical protein